jgi:hypothetical protein
MNESGLNSVVWRCKYEGLSRLHDIMWLFDIYLNVAFVEIPLWMIDIQLILFFSLDYLSRAYA